MAVRASDTVKREVTNLHARTCAHAPATYWRSYKKVQEVYACACIRVSQALLVQKEGIAHAHGALEVRTPKAPASAEADTDSKACPQGKHELPFEFRAV